MTVIKPTFATAGALLLLATSASASALERHGSSEIDIDGRKVEHNFASSYNPEDHTLTRSGTIRLANGMRFTYALSGTCEPEQRRCALSGRGTGPRGREWTGNGNFRRDGDKTVIKATLTGPAKRTITIDRTVEGAPFPEFDF